MQRRGHRTPQVRDELTIEHMMQWHARGIWQYSSGPGHPYRWRYSITQWVLWQQKTPIEKPKSALSLFPRRQQATRKGRRRGRMSTVRQQWGPLKSWIWLVIFLNGTLDYGLFGITSVWEVYIAERHLFYNCQIKWTPPSLFCHYRFIIYAPPNDSQYNLKI